MGKYIKAPRIVVTAVLLIGLGLLTYSLTLPYYTNQKSANELITASYQINKPDYYKREAELRTKKIDYMDLGTGLVIASTTILLFLLVSRTQTLSDFRRIKSLNKPIILIASNLVWILLIPGTYWYYSFRGWRGDYPPFADSIGIPISTQVPVYLFALIPLNIFLALTIIKSNLPTKIFIKFNFQNKFTIFWEVFFGFWLIINFLLSVSLIIDGDHFFIPVNLFFTYILLSLRAGHISKWPSKQVLLS